MKYGIRCSKKGKTQIYKCKDCDRRFTPNEGFLYTKYTKEIVTLSLDLYFKGLSLRKIQHHLKQFYNVSIHHTTILYWIKKYSLLINSFLNTLKAQSSDSWGADETGLYFKRNLNWLWGIIDNETKFLIALQLTKFRFVPKDNVFIESKKAMKGNPQVIVTDGFRGYEGMAKENYPNSEHIILKGVSDRGLNNTSERLWGNVKERYKVMRGFRSFKGGKIILDGWKSYYNFIRPHMSLNGKTPAETAGLNLKLENNKWLNLIQRSVRNVK